MFGNAKRNSHFWHNIVTTLSEMQQYEIASLIVHSVHTVLSISLKY